MQTTHRGTWLGVVACVLVSCGGSAQFVAQAPGERRYSSIRDELKKGADAMGCTTEVHEGAGGRSFSVSCSKPEHRYVSLAEKENGTDFLWTCSMSESACRAFVDELLAAAR